MRCGSNDFNSCHPERSEGSFRPLIKDSSAEVLYNANGKKTADRDTGF